MKFSQFQFLFFLFFHIFFLFLDSRLRFFVCVCLQLFLCFVAFSIFSTFVIANIRARTFICRITSCYIHCLFWIFGTNFSLIQNFHDRIRLVAHFNLRFFLFLFLFFLLLFSWSNMWIYISLAQKFNLTEESRNTFLSVFHFISFLFFCWLAFLCRINE